MTTDSEEPSLSLDAHERREFGLHPRPLPTAKACLSLERHSMSSLRFSPLQQESAGAQRLPIDCLFPVDQPYLCLKLPPYGLAQKKSALSV